MLQFLKGNWKNLLFASPATGATVVSLYGALVTEGVVARFTLVAFSIVFLSLTLATLSHMKWSTNGNTKTT